jgi:hypothetical protein
MRPNVQVQDPNSADLGAGHSDPRHPVCDACDPDFARDTGDACDPWIDYADVADVGTGDPDPEPAVCIACDSDVAKHAEFAIDPESAEHADVGAGHSDPWIAVCTARAAELASDARTSKLSARLTREPGFASNCDRMRSCRM